MHPGKLNKNQLANFALYFNSGVEHWVVDRMASFDHFIVRAVTFRGAKNNIINRAFTKQITTFAIFYDGSDGNVIQNSRFDTMKESARKNDNCSILFFQGSGYKSFSMKNNKILNNEFVNQNDAIQIARQTYDGVLQEANCEGTIIDNNHISLRPNIYTDGNGNYTPNGERAYAENAMDFKAASENVNNPVIITNNILWGFRRSDKTDSHCDDAGGALATHFNTPNMVIEDNIIFDSAGGFGSGDSRNYTLALENTSIKRNLFYRVGQYPNSTSRSTTAMQLTEVDTTTIQHNVFINCRHKLGLMAWNKKGVTFINNDIINCPDAEIRNNIGGIYEFETSPRIEYTKDLKFTTDNYTNNQKTMTLENVLKK
ncbi:MAG TPA: hypothetical protein ENK66_08830 [Arcobacter sp.]|nr:hypothetical protein [Arcobacter sp.]